MEWIDQGDGRRMLVLAALSVLFLSPSLFSSRVLLPLDLLPTLLPWAAETQRAPVNNPIISDHIEESLPYHALFRQSILAGELAFWNPYNAFGTPIAGTPASSFFSPFRWILFWLPVTLFFEIRGLFILILAGLGVYLFLRRLRIVPDAALAGALAYQFGGYTVYTLGHPSGDNSAVFGWMFLFTEIYLEEKDRRAAVALVLVLACSYLSGQLQLALFQHMVLTLYVLVRGRRRIAGFLMISVLGISTAAVSLFPFFLHLLREVPLGEASTLRQAVHLPASEVLHFLVPNFQGSEGSFFLPASRSPGSFLFIGTLPVLLALISLRGLLGSGNNGALNRSVRMSLGAAVLFTLLLLVGIQPVQWFLSVVPLLNIANYLHLSQPLLGLVCFMAAFGLDDLIRHRQAHFGLLFCGLLTVNGFLWGFGFNTSASPEPLTRLPPAMEEIVARPFQRVLVLGVVLPPNLSIYYQTHDVRGYQAMQMHRFRRYMQSWPVTWNDPHYFLPEEINEEVLLAARRAGCSLLLTGVKLDLPELDPIVDAFPYLYSIRGGARAAFVGRAELASSEEQALSLVFSDPDDSALVLEASEPVPSTTASGIVVWESSQPNEVVLEVRAETAGWLVLRDTFHPSWQADIDGSPVKIYPADYLFRAVRVPGGTHRVRFTYQPLWIARGAKISLLALVLTLAICLGGAGERSGSSKSEARSSN